MNKFAIMVHFTTHCLSLLFLCCSSRERATWSRKYGGYGACFRRFLVVIPIESQYHTPSFTKESACEMLKLEHSIECFDGPSQLLRCRFLHANRAHEEIHANYILHHSLYYTPSSNTTPWHSYLCSYTEN